jgi:hypothetical protein
MDFEFSNVSAILYKKIIHIPCSKCESQLEASYFVITTYHVWNIVHTNICGVVLFILPTRFTYNLQILNKTVHVFKDPTNTGTRS